MSRARVRAPWWRRLAAWARDPRRRPLEPAGPLPPCPAPRVRVPDLATLQDIVHTHGLRLSYYTEDGYVVATLGGVTMPEVAAALEAAARALAPSRIVLLHDWPGDPARPA